MATNMADELRQAAVREFARLDAEESAREAMTGACSQERMDRYHLASEVMASHPADDGEPVTPSRLMAAGARHDGFGQYTVGTGPWTLSFFDDGPGELYIKAAFFCEAPTWGQFRKLAAALGIELPAAATDGPGC